MKQMILLLASLVISAMENGPDNFCCICMSEVTNEMETLQSNSCKHVYHFECMKTWLEENNTCPMCRKKIEKIFKNSDDCITFAEFRNSEYNQIQNSGNGRHSWVSRQLGQEAPITRKIWYSVLLWSIVEIEILVGKFLLAKWANWFVGMQALQIISFIVISSSKFASVHSNARVNWLYGSMISLFTAAMSYASMIQKSFPKSEAFVMAFWMFYPFVALLLIAPSFLVRPSEEIGRFHPLLSIFWIALETIILFAQEYSWCKWYACWSWFMWVQGLQAISMFLLLLLSVKKNAATYGIAFFLLIITAIITLVAFIG